MARSAPGSARRVVGKIIEWSDERGYGFVLPNGGDQKRFLHIKAFASATRRPTLGDAVAYTPGFDERGRATAIDVTFNVLPSSVPTVVDQSATSWRAVTGGMALSTVGASGFLGLAPTTIMGLFGIASVMSFLLYRRDKAAAGSGRRRTPEATLHLWALLGGWPGALVAQHVFRHKTRKGRFQQVFWITVTGNALALLWLVTSETGRDILAALKALDA